MYNKSIQKIYIFLLIFEEVVLGILKFNKIFDLKVGNKILKKYKINSDLFINFCSILMLLKVCK